MEYVPTSFFYWLHQFQTDDIVTTILILIFIDVAACIYLSPNFTRAIVRIVLWATVTFPLSELLRRYAGKIQELPSEYYLVVASLLIFGTSIYLELIRQLREMTARRRLRTGGFKQYEIHPFTDFNTGESDYGEGIIRLSPDIMKSLNVRRHSLVGSRGASGATLYRFVRGTPKRLEKSDNSGEASQELDYTNSIGLELDDRYALGARSAKAALKLWKAGPLNYLGFLLNHTNMLTRLNFGISLLVALLGILAGILVAVFSKSLSSII